MSCDLQHRRDGGVLHEPEYSVERLVYPVYPVRRPESRFYGAAVAVPDILAHHEELAVGVYGSPAVLESQQELVVLAAHRVVLHLVEICGFKGYRVLLLDVDDYGVVMEYRYIILALVLGVRKGGFS